MSFKKKTKYKIIHYYFVHEKEKEQVISLLLSKIKFSHLLIINTHIPTAGTRGSTVFFHSNDLLIYYIYFIFLKFNRYIKVIKI